LRGKVSVIFGPPGNAKSFFAMNLVTEYMKYENGVKCAYLPMEYSKLDHVKRAMAVHANSWRVVSESRTEDKQSVLDWLMNTDGVVDYLSGLDKCILDNPGLGKMNSDGNILIPSVDFPKIFDIVARESADKDFIIIDPITSIDPDDKSRLNEWEQQKMFVKQLGVIAEHNDCHIMMLSHSNKRGKHKGNETKLTMDDLAGSSALSRFVQYMLIIDYHDEKKSMCSVGHGNEYFDHTRTMIIAKTNFGTGKGCRLAMDFSDTGPEMEIYGMIVKDDEAMG